MKIIFNKYRLDDITDKIGDGIHGTPEYDDNGKYYFINGNNLVNGDIVVKNDTKKINKEQYLKNKRELNRNTILLSINGTLGNIARYNNENIILGKSACYINVKNEYNVDYVYFVFETSDFKKYLYYRANGTTIKNVPLSAIRNYEISIPNKENQDKIVKILKNIEDKIKLNNKINRNLFEILSKLYNEKYLKNLSYYNWEDSYLYDITCKFATGLNPRKNFVLGKGNNFYVTIKNMPNNQVILDDKCDKIDDEAIIKINKRSDLKVGDLLFSGIGTIGRTYLIKKQPINWNISESVFTIRPSSKISSEFLYLLLLSPDMQNYVISKASGSVQKGIRMADLKMYKLKLPDKEWMNNFTRIIKPIINKIYSNFEVNDNLSQLRDTLLPKLMNGEIDLDNVEI